MNKEFINIYIEDRLLQLIITKDVPFILIKENEKLVEFTDDNSLIEKSIIELEKNEFSRIVLHHTDLNTLFKNFKSFYSVVAAAGGVVKNDKDEILSIFRRGNWDFPKGKIEDGEKKREWEGVWYN